MNTKILSACASALALMALAACNSIEPDSDFRTEGDPISAEELRQALTVTQLENDDSKGVGDEYIVVRNARPDIGGCWHLSKGGKDVKTYGFDSDTIIVPDNGDYELYFVGIHRDHMVRTEPFQFTVTNVYHPWMGLFSGSKDKSDRHASKKWVFRGVKQGSHYLICGAGGHGVWNDVGPEAWNTFVWWDYRYENEAASYSMTFYRDGSRFESTDADGNVKYQGNFSFTTTAHEGALIGDLTTTVPLPAGDVWDYVGQKKSGDSVFWIWELTDKVMTLYHPEKYSGGAAWDDCGWYAYFQAAD